MEFPEVTTRFVKVVVAPLDPSVPQASDWPDILVTEIEVFLRRPADSIETERSSDEQSGLVAVRTLLHRPNNAYLDTSYSFRTGSRRATEWVLTNAASFRRTVGSIYTFGGRVERNDVRDSGRTDSFLRYSLRMSAAPLRTLRHSVLISGSNGSADGLNESDGGVTFSSWARLYEGLETSFSVGRTYLDRSIGDGIEVERLNASALITPHRSLRVRLTATERSSQTRFAGSDESREQFQKFGEISVTYSPVPAVYLFGSYERQEREDVDPQDTRQLQASFSPFPNGTLRFSVELFEEYRPESGLTDRRVSPTVRWDIRPGWLLEASLSRTTEEFVARTEKRDTLFARLQVFF
jgi:hypothetical protein